MEKSDHNIPARQSVTSKDILYWHRLDGIWLDGQELMQQLHVSERTLWRLRARGVLAYSKLGRKIFYRKEDIALMLERAKRTGIQKV